MSETNGELCEPKVDVGMLNTVKIYQALTLRLSKSFCCDEGLTPEHDSLISSLMTESPDRLMPVWQKLPYPAVTLFITEKYSMHAFTRR